MTDLTDLFNNPAIVAALFIALAIWPALLVAYERRTPRDRLLDLADIMDGIAENGIGLDVMYQQHTPGVDVHSPVAWTEEEPSAAGDSALCSACLAGIAYLAFCAGDRPPEDVAYMDSTGKILDEAAGALWLTRDEQRVMFAGDALDGLSAGDAESLACPDAALAAQACRRLAAGESDVWIDIPDATGRRAS